MRYKNIHFALNIGLFMHPGTGAARDVHPSHTPVKVNILTNCLYKYEVLNYGIFSGMCVPNASWSDICASSLKVF